MNTPQDSSLGREVAYPSQYDSALLFPIPRRGAREEIGLDEAALPFVGHDRWQAYELSWLDRRGKPRVAVATVSVPCTSPNLIESKSFKLYLNSLNSTRFDDDEAARLRITADLSGCAGAVVTVRFGVPMLVEEAEGESLDELDVAIERYGPPAPEFLSADAAQVVTETLSSALLKSNCPVTGQPDWASVSIRYHGPQIDREGLLKYLVSYREHAEFHEQCVERIFSEITQRCAPQWLEVEARYTRRGGLDINPWRASPGIELPARTVRELRQ
ncbi:NADPH-dependent 7-cyano-7-deazaguanine reductase QueF [Stenotrophomonas rhizophila]